MLNKNFYLLVIAFSGYLFLNINYVFSQANYREGYIVKSDKDTVFGYIDYRNWDKNPTQIHFKKHASDFEYLIYYPADLLSFNVANEIYISRFVEVELTPDKPEKLTYDPYGLIIEDTVFLQVLIYGKASLYLFKTDLDRINYYIQKDTSEIILLIYRRYLKVDKISGKHPIVTNNNYLGQLTYIFNDCPLITKKNKDIPYKTEPLYELIQAYNLCQSSTENSYSKHRSKIKFEAGLFIGLTITKLKFMGDERPKLTLANFPLSYNPTFGGFLEFVLPRNREVNSIRAEFLYKRYNTHTSHEYNYNYHKYIIHDLRFQMEYFKCNFLLKHKFPINNKIKPFFNAGISFGSLNGYRNEITIQDLFYGHEEPVTKPAVDEVYKSNLGLLIGGGILYNKFGFEVRYEYSNGFVTKGYPRTNVHSIYFNINFRLI